MILSIAALTFGLLGARAAVSETCPLYLDEPVSVQPFTNECSFSLNGTSCTTCCGDAKVCCDNGACIDFDPFCRFPAECCSDKYCGDRCCSSDYGQACGPYCAPNAFYCCNAATGQMCEKPNECCGGTCYKPASEQCCGNKIPCSAGQVCCNDGEYCCDAGNSCAGAGTCCNQGNAPCGGTCCPSETFCASASDHVCCPNSYVYAGNRKCCPKDEPNLCGTDTCCADGYTCCGGNQCCPPGDKCSSDGKKCCHDADTYCPGSGNCFCGSCSCYGSGCRSDAGQSCSGSWFWKHCHENYNNHGTCNTKNTIDAGKLFSTRSLNRPFLMDKDLKQNYPPGPTEVITPSTFDCYNSPTTMNDPCSAFQCMDQMSECGAVGVFNETGNLLCYNYKVYKNDFESSGQQFLTCTANCNLENGKEIFKDDRLPCCKSAEKFLHSKTKECMMNCNFCGIFWQNASALQKLFGISSTDVDLFFAENCY